MRKIFLVVLLLSVVFRGMAAEDTAARAERLYREGKYAEAAEIYQQVLSEGQESSELYYNLGNAYFKMGENTRAILNYERSLLLNPADRMARYNLNMARQAVVDKIDVLPELFIVRWYKAVETHYSADQWGYISVGLFVLFLVMAALFFYSRSVGLRKTGFFVGILVLLLTLTTVFFAIRQDRRISEREYAVITTPSVTVKGAPDSSGTDLFLIHEGLKVKVIGELGNWYNIRLADGNEGWVAKTDMERI